MYRFDWTAVRSGIAISECVLRDEWQLRLRHAEFRKSIGKTELANQSRDRIFGPNVWMAVECHRNLTLGGRTPVVIPTQDRSQRHAGSEAVRHAAYRSKRVAYGMASTNGNTMRRAGHRHPTAKLSLGQVRLSWLSSFLVSRRDRRQGMGKQPQGLFRKRRGVAAHRTRAHGLDCVIDRLDARP